MVLPVVFRCLLVSSKQEQLHTQQQRKLANSLLSV